MRTLVVRLSALGDLVHTLPVVAALRRGDPTGRIDWLVDERFSALVDLVPVIDRRMTWPRRGSSLASYVRAVRALRRERYDVALDVQGLFKSSVAAWLGGATRVVGFDRAGLRETAAGWFHNERARATSPGHVIEKNLTLVSHLGIEPRPWAFPIETSPSLVVPRVREQLAVGDEEPFVVANPGSAWPSKCWPPGHYGELAKRLSAECGLRVVVSWGPGEHDLAARVVEAAGWGPRSCHHPRMSATWCVCCGRRGSSWVETPVHSTWPWRCGHRSWRSSGRAIPSGTVPGGPPISSCDRRRGAGVLRRDAHAEAEGWWCASAPSPVLVWRRYRWTTCSMPPGVDWPSAVLHLRDARS